MKKITIALDPKSLLIAAISIALFNHVDTEAGKAISFALAFIFSADFVITFLKGILFPAPEIKAINMNASDIPPHIKEKADEVTKLMRDWMKENEDEKCNNPHCKNCHPELND